MIKGPRAGPWSVIKSRKIMNFAQNADYCSSLQQFSPLFELLDYVATFVEGDIFLLSYASLSLILIRKYLVQINLSLIIFHAAKRPLQHQLNPITFYVHCLAVILHSRVPKSRCCALQFLFEDNAFNASAKKASDKSCDWFHLL